MTENLIYLTDENFDTEVTNNNSLIIIDFWAEWCGPCRMMAPVFEKLSAEYVGKLRFAKLDTDKYPQIAAQFGIQGIPSLFVIKKAEVIDKIVGFAPEPVLKQKINEILAKV